MQNSPSTVIEFTCACGATHPLQPGQAGISADITCESCGRTVYWHVCPVCKKGWSDNDPDSACPACAPGRKPPVWSRLGLVRRPCPHCSGALTSFMLLLGNTHGIITCPHCRRKSRLKGAIFVVPVLLFYFLAAALVVYRMDLNLRSPVNIMAFGALFFWCSVEVMALVVRPHID